MSVQERTYIMVKVVQFLNQGTKTQESDRYKTIA
jgi:hypothetical protein